jgi:hypothetical protein
VAARVLPRRPSVAIPALPSSVDTATRQAAEVHLVEQAAIFDPEDLARLGCHVLDVVAPDEADRLFGEALRREEARANGRHPTTLSDAQRAGGHR